MSEAENSSTIAAPADENRDDVIKHLKDQLAAKTEGEARANARMAVYESKERARISAWQPEAKNFMCDFINEEIEQHHPQLKDDVAVFTGASGWAHTYHEKPDIAAQGALAAVSYVASKGIKRLREQASQGAQAATTLAETMKQNEELVATNAKLMKDCNDYKVLSDERQKGLEALQAELTRAGLFSEQFNFSKLTSREKEAPLPSEPHASAVAAPSLEVVKAEASKAAGAASANPVKQEDLLDTLLGRSNGGLRVGPSGTNHAHLGQINGEPDIGALLRGSAM
tara:strand:+ start:3584 stop:4435 length:852 start_codon:yes stop_codon:yes gene_type:complete